MKSRSELASQVVDVNLDRIAGDLILEAIQFLLDLGPRHESARPRISSSATAYSRAVSAAGSPWKLTRRRRVSSTTSPAVSNWPGAAEHAARDGAQPRPELIDVKGFDQVVIRAGVQTGDAVGNAIARRNDDNGRGAPVVAQPAQHGKSIAARQTQIQQQRTEGRGRQRRQRSAPVLHPIDHVPLLAQSVLDCLTEHGVVFHQQDPHRCDSSAPTRRFQHRAA